ncbi:hypothetical protein NDU88_004029 [Pleurodeles waltl]|uniref:Uncharacterized protein n=1 Tax=Pleurodeles waltl TaxID=8319 RepID=A0AAV7T857_PLEWA|nr:hypothetical protein NDU88_004029 [Pleurodeles waltl]
MPVLRPLGAMLFAGRRDPTAGLCHFLDEVGSPPPVLPMFSHSHRLLCRPRCGLSGRYSAYVVLRPEEPPAKAAPPCLCQGYSGFTPGPASLTKLHSAGRYGPPPPGHNLWLQPR